MDISFYDDELEDGLAKFHELYRKKENTSNNTKPKTSTKNTDKYDETIINTSIPGSEIVEMVKNALENNVNGNPSIRLLFYGLSGAGKTALAKHIAKSIKRPLIKKNTSDILDQYTGNAEKNVAAAFKEATKKNAILLFDEADSFIYNRSDNSSSWQHQLVNEFLTQIENFKEILICTTNFKNDLDSAIFRRFHICVEFKALKKEGMETLLKNYFPEYDFSTEQKEKIFHLNTITPGDFGVLSERLRFINQNNHNASYITEQLCHLQEEKNNGSKTIGFGF